MQAVGRSSRSHVSTEMLSYSETRGSTELLAVELGRQEARKAGRPPRP